jgi:hypothetical protein
MRSIQKPFLLMFALSLGAPIAAQEPTRVPQTYGTSAVSYVEVPAEAFTPLDSSTTYGTAISGRWSTNCASLCFAAPVYLPSGAKVVYLELDYYDFSAAGAVSGTLGHCDHLNQNCTFHPAAGAGPADCLQAQVICSGNAFAAGAGFETADLTADALSVDNSLGSLRLLVSAQGNLLQISGMIVGYVLQVSPAPGAPSFNDVPTNHPFFQYIEALKASGITGGCQANPPLYCPDAPLTRGQMAVFLAKALGLQWN